MRNRFSLPLIATAGLLAVPATGLGAVVPQEGVSVSLPAVRGIQAVQVCTQVGAYPSCKTVGTPRLRGGRISAQWNRALETDVTATPVTPFPAQCGGKPGAAIRASVSHVATDIRMTVQATYGRTSASATILDIRRTVRANQGASLWACLL